MATYILGISAYYHDSAAALICDGDITAAAQEERFTRKKHDHRFPTHAIQYCFNEADVSIKDIDYVVFYDKPFLKFERLLLTYLNFAPVGIRSFLKAMPQWIKQKIFLKDFIAEELEYDGPILFTEHHQSHAASAFYPSPYEKAAVLTMDGVGEWATTSYGIGDGNQLKLQAEIPFPHSLGLLYSAFTYYIGFRVNSGEYKLMGLAPYGEPRYADHIREHLMDVKEDGSFRLDMRYFNYCAGLTMTNKKFHDLFGGPPRVAESEIRQKDMDIARSIQVVTEEIMLKIAKHVHRETGMENLCLAGGVALNCVGNGRIVREGPFKNVWIQPAAGDAGGALGAALYIWYQYLAQQRISDNVKDHQKGSYLGPAYTTDEIKKALDGTGAVYEELSDDEVADRVAHMIAEEGVVGLFAHRMEFGPRALGARSIIGDPRSERMQQKMNLKIKFRESFRPFAPSVLRERVHDYFDHQGESPYMLLVADVQADKVDPASRQKHAQGLERLNIRRSDIPAITHVDYSARIQTVSQEHHRLYYDIIKAFEKRTGCPVVINTSFNIRGEPIVCTPQDAYRCFMCTDMDFLVLGNIVLTKTKQTNAVQFKKENYSLGLD